MAIKKEEEIEEKLKELKTQRQYLWNFLSTIYKNSKPKEQIDKELTALDREIKILEWVIISELPF